MMTGDTLAVGGACTKSEVRALAHVVVGRFSDGKCAITLQHSRT